MTLCERLKGLRRDIGISQEAMGAQGFVSTPGWVKIENGQRSPSEALIMRLVSWLVRDGHLGVNTAQALLDELLILKYLGSSSPFIHKMAVNYAERVAAGTVLLAAEDRSVYRANPGRQQRPSHG